MWHLSSPLLLFLNTRNFTPHKSLLTNITFISSVVRMRMSPKSGGGTRQACAACKFQRRRCTSDCILAPFFPADQSQIFQDVHRLFGVKHVQKVLKDLNTDDREQAIESIKLHASMRREYPVLGCTALIQNLHDQILFRQQQLHAIRQQLVYYRQRHHQQCDEGEDFHHKNDRKYRNVHVDSMWMQQPFRLNNMKTQAMPSREETRAQDYNEMHSFFEDSDERQSCFGSKEVYDPSFDSLLTDSRQCDEEMAEDELKNAAACFSLTSFN